MSLENPNRKTAPELNAVHEKVDSLEKNVMKLQSHIPPVDSIVDQVENPKQVVDGQRIDKLRSDVDHLKQLCLGGQKLIDQIKDLRSSMQKNNSSDNHSISKNNLNVTKEHGLENNSSIKNKDMYATDKHGTENSLSSKYEKTNETEDGLENDSSSLNKELNIIEDGPMNDSSNEKEEMIAIEDSPENDLSREKEKVQTTEDYPEKALSSENEKEMYVTKEVGPDNDSTSKNGNMVVSEYDGLQNNSRHKKKGKNVSEVEVIKKKKPKREKKAPKYLNDYQV